MTTQQLAALIGTQRFLSITSQTGSETIQVPVNVVDAKTQFGVVRLVVEPIGGAGKMLVNMDRTSETLGN